MVLRFWIEKRRGQVPILLVLMDMAYRRNDAYQARRGMAASLAARSMEGGPDNEVERYRAAKDRPKRIGVQSKHGGKSNKNVQNIVEIIPRPNVAIRTVTCHNEKIGLFW